MDLVQPHYIEPREGENCISLDGTWEFCYTDTVKELDELRFAYKTELPCSVYHSLHRSGVLPDPYVGTNSSLYRFAADKVWYYRRRFSVCKDVSYQNAYLCFDGVAYYCRVFLNGEVLGEHEGMFGGPVIDVAKKLRQGENELIVEVRSLLCEDSDYQIQRHFGKAREIVPWNIVLDKWTSNGDFIVIGIWNHVRLVLLPKMHLSRPYLYTESANEKKAVLHFETEIFDGSIHELEKNRAIAFDEGYPRAFDAGVTGKLRDECVDLRMEIYDGEECVYTSQECVPLIDHEASRVNATYREAQIFTKKIEIDTPKLWYPVGIGDPHLYDVRVTMLYHGDAVDVLTFKCGVRTFTADYTKGRKWRAGWNKFLFNINGKDFFLKGMNWTPIDFLYSIDPDRYEWCLTLAKNAGIQLIRVWNGGGMPESDVFYELCDKLGIMVWQDQFLANSVNTSGYPQEVLDAQCAYNLYRTRNHPSLVLLCGGNEFNPYSPGNAANMFVMLRNAETLAPDRIFHYATADKGSAHIYHDMEPVWYRYGYAELPFVGESGIHSFPNYKTLKQFISEREATAVLPPLEDEKFKEEFPDIINHFTEYNPERVPRMTARISQITDMKNITLRELCEASAVQGYEWYQLMIQAMRSNYPVCGGIMPWVFKRPWPTAGIQTVDGDDRPSYCYYAVKNAYANVTVAWLQPWSVIAPEEELSLVVRVLSDEELDFSDTLIKLTIYRPDLTKAAEFEEMGAKEIDFGRFAPDKSFTDTCFLVCAEIYRKEELLSRSVYFNKCTSLLGDKTLYEKYRTSPTETLRFDNGPWLKEDVKHAKRAVLQAKIICRGKEGRYSYAIAEVENVSAFPAYPVTLDLVSEKQRCFLSDNFFLLKEGEKKTVKAVCDTAEIEEIEISLWNGDSITVK